MTLITLLIFLVIAGVALYLIPMEPAIKGVITKIVIVVACIFVLVWLLQLFNLMPAGHGLRLN